MYIPLPLRQVSLFMSEKRANQVSYCLSILLQLKALFCNDLMYVYTCVCVCFYYTSYKSNKKKKEEIIQPYLLCYCNVTLKHVFMTFLCCGHFFIYFFFNFIHMHMYIHHNYRRKAGPYASCDKQNTIKNENKSKFTLTISVNIIFVFALHINNNNNTRSNPSLASLPFVCLYVCL